ncbi:T9SS sorting signal type C domain-containing protein [Flavobacterium azooxidireducens]|uniref:T9SS sorting signal type C domain-containing protein n=1 Tax=Flavobacterium azooxidireducens TaxID=1871076 RepID=A0ABY4KFU5_9FLAO|nr:T9SS sorting signal type C domain-containing protein [Flavobacterium azooxidireducens]UPQ79681.1 T9SS sorting signal type C domain-containing protein [Flavobacterium azooxidireducens]
MNTNFNSIQHFCFTIKAVITLIFIVFSAEKVSGQNGQFVLSDGLGGDPFIIGSTASNWHSAPFLSSKKDSRIQYLYEAEELGLAYSEGYRTITSLAFNVTGFSNSAILSVYEMKNITIKMGHTIANYDGYGGKEVWGIDMPLEGECTWAGSPTPEYLQVVKTPFDLIISETGWVELELDIPFVWDGVSSIVVEICKSDSGSSFPNHRYQFESTNRISSTASYTLTRSLNSINNGGSVHTPGCEMKNRGLSYNTSSSVLNASQRKIRPNIRFTFQCAGAPEGGDAIILSENYCLGGDVILHVVNDEKSSGLNYQWASSPTDFGFVDLPGETQATLVVERAEVDMWYQRTVGCDYDVPAGLRYSAPIKVKGINTWDGTFWSFGTEPTVNDPVKISGDFDTAVDGSSVLEACSLQVLSGTFTVKSGDIISLKEKLFVHDDATVIFENNASLIQENNAAINEGKIVYKRDSQPLRLLDYTYWSSPVSGMTPSQFSAGTPTNRIYHWNHLTTGLNPQSWVGGVANLPMVAGKGYIIRAPNGYPSTGAGTVFAGAFEGVPNNGIVTVPAQGDLEKWNLIGNPYPAAIDIDKFLIANSSILEGTIRLWTHNTLPSAIPSYPGFSPQALNYSSDDYATYNLSGSIGFPADNSGVNNATPGRFVGAGQSFMVAGRGAPSGDVIFNNEMRKKESGYDNSQFFRNGTSNQAEIEKNRLWLEVIHQNGKFNQTMVGYIEGATNDIDWGYDSKFRHTGDVKIYSLVGESKLAIQGKALPFNSNDTIPLGLTTILSGEFILNLYQFDNFFENQEVYLLDKYTNTFHNIKEGLYAFTSISGTFDDRFELRFTNETLSLNPIINTKNSILCYANDSNIIVKSKDVQIQSIMVFDSAGRLLFNKNKMDATEIIITDIAKNNQLLLVQITTEDDIKSTQKIIY